MAEIPVEIVFEGKTVVFERSQNRVTHSDVQGRSALKRRAPKPPKAKPSDAKKDEQNSAGDSIS